MGTKNGKWDGKGRPPSVKAAAEWVKDNGGDLRAFESLTGVDPGDLTATPKALTLNAVGEAARRVVGDDDPGIRLGRINVADVPTIQDVVDLFGGDKKKSSPAASKDQREAEALAKAAADGTITPEEQAEAEAAGFEFPDLGVVDTRGAPLWPYDVDSATLGGITVTDQSANRFQTQRSERASGINNFGPQAIGPRYFDADSLEPLKWEEEQRDALKRIMFDIGLYGDGKVSSSRWTGTDQQLYKLLLAHANVNGLTWKEQLARWKREPPEDILAEIDGSGGSSKPIIAITAPADIQQTARTSSQSLVGRVDRGLLGGVTSAYQGIEAAVGATNAALSESGEGGTVVQAPSISAFVDDKLRREQPLEVDGYEFLNQFQDFMRMLGVG